MAARAADGPCPIPAAFLDLFQKATYAHLATLMADGTPHVTPVWVDWDGRHVLVNSAAGRQKDLNMARRRQVAIEIPDPDNPNRYVHVRGPVVEITEAGADAHLDRLAERYLGRATYPEGCKLPGEVRRVYKISREGHRLGPVRVARPTGRPSMPKLVQAVNPPDRGAAGRLLARVRGPGRQDALSSPGRWPSTRTAQVVGRAISSRSSARRART